MFSMFRSVVHTKTGQGPFRSAGIDFRYTHPVFSLSLRHVLRRFALLFVMSCTMTAAHAQSSSDRTSPVFFAGERLQYKVSWLFFRLGTIVVTTEKLPPSTAGEMYRVVIRVESNPTIFFVSVHNEYESIISASSVKPIAFTARELGSSDTIVTQYFLNEDLRQLRMVQWHDPGQTERKEEVLDSVNIFYEGASMFFLARSLIHSALTVTVPTLVQFDLFNTDITITKNVEAVSIDALDDDVETLELHGYAHFVESSLGGLTGEFQGWFTNDEAAIPVLAKMQLSLGTANIELEEWSRGSWSPPPYREK